MIFGKPTSLWPVQNWEIGTSLSVSPMSFVSIADEIDGLPSPVFLVLRNCLLAVTIQILSCTKIPNSVFLTESPTALVWDFKSKWHPERITS